MNPRNCGMYVMRRLDQVLYWCLKINFVSGKENFLADWLSRQHYWLSHGTLEAVGRINAIIPEREKIISSLHGPGHIGSRAIMELLNRKNIDGYSWKQDVEEYIKTCDTCQRWQSKIRREPFGHLVSKKFNDIIGMDFVGPLPKDDKNNRFMIVMIDYCTRWVMSIPSVGAKAQNAVKAVMKWMNEQGKPLKIMADTGPAFRSYEFNEFCIKNKIQLLLAAPHNHQANGMAERVISTIEHKIAKIGWCNGLTWFVNLKKAIEIYNNTPHTITKATPNELYLGIDPFGQKIDKDIQLEKIKISNENTNKYRSKWDERRMDEIKQVKNIFLGTEVLVYNWAKKNSHSAKFSPEWNGPAKVVKILGTGRYEIRYRKGKFAIVHGDSLRIYKRREACEVT